MAEEKRSVLENLEALGSMAEQFGEEDELESLLNGAELPPGLGNFQMPGMPKEVGLFDTVVVHGFRADYRLTFEETDEGLVIRVAK